MERIVPSGGFKIVEEGDRSSLAYVVLNPADTKNRGQGHHCEGVDVVAHDSLGSAPRTSWAYW